MHPLSQHARRRLCRAGFIAGCLLPTLGVLSWVVMLKLPMQRLAAERELATRLDAEVSIGSISYPLPGITRCEVVSVSDRQTGRMIARAARVESRHEAGEQRITVDGVELFAAAGGLGPACLRCLARGAHDSDAARIVVPRASIVREDGTGARATGHELVNVEVHWQPAEHRWRLAARVAGEEGPSTEPLTASVDVLPSGKVAVELKTGDAPLRAALVAVVLPEVTRLGETAEFRGRLRFEGSVEPGSVGSHESRSALTLAGEIVGCDFGRLLADAVPADLAIDGRGSLSIAAVEFRNGRLARASGRFNVGPGTAGPRFVMAAADALRLSAHDELRRRVPRGPIAFGELAVGFEIAADGVKLSGLCRGAPSGTIMIGAGGETLLLASDTAAVLPATALARLFSPETTDWVPATRQSEWLLGRLPQAGRESRVDLKR